MTTDRSGGDASAVSSAADGAALAQRIGARRWELTVADGAMRTRSTRRITLTAPDLVDLRYQPGQDLMFTLLGPDGGPVRRRYTIRSSSPEERRVDVDVVLHGNGPGRRWAERAMPGSTVEAIGPRGKVTPRPDAAWHLFVGDESFTPAALVMAESLRDRSASCRLLLLVDGREDEQPAALGSGASLVWMHRRPGTADGVLLVAALRELALPLGTGHAYLGGEKATVAEVRAALLERGFDAAAVSPKAYWRAGAANASHGEPGDR